MFRRTTSTSELNKVGTKLLDGRLIKTSSFGDQRYQQFKDRTPLQLYKAGDHLDERRRVLYHKRHNYKAVKYSPGWFSKRYLW